MFRQFMDTEGEVLSYFYYACFCLCLVAALFVLTQGTS